MNNGSHGFVPCGTTGESPTLSHDEHKKVIEECVRVVDNVYLLLLEQALTILLKQLILLNHAEKCGADAALVVTPYYNKPTQDGLYQSF